MSPRKQDAYHAFQERRRAGAQAWTDEDTRRVDELRKKIKTWTEVERQEYRVLVYRETLEAARRRGRQS